MQQAAARAVIAALWVVGCAAPATSPQDQDPDDDPEPVEIGGQGGGDESGGRGGSAGRTPERDAGPVGGTGGESPDGGGAGAPGADAGGRGGADEMPPPGTVPVVVALGDGAFTMSSCDRGRSWKTKNQFSGERGDHTSWTAFGGLAFGSGRFVAALGWGAPGHIVGSADAVTWAEVPDAQFTRGGMPQGLNDSIGGLAFTGEEFVAYSRYVWRSKDGLAWTTGAGQLPPGAEQLRQLRAFPREGVVVASVESQSGRNHPTGNFVVVSSDGGKTWREGTGFDSRCANPIQHVGDIAMIGDVIVVAADNVCRSGDRGMTWKALGQPMRANVAGLFADGTSFYALAGGRLHQSSDGETWTALSVPPGGAELGAAVGGGFVVMKADGSNVQYSNDGRAWTKSDRLDVGGQRIRDLQVGYVTPGAACPVP